MRFLPTKQSLAALIIVIPLSSLCFTNPVYAESESAVDTAEFISQFYDQNERCFRCHGSSKYTYYNSSSEKEVTAMMCNNRLVTREEFYTANHKSFACTDCHAADYDTFPHPGELRMEEKYNCIDCHGYDEKYAQFNFEGIEKEFLQSAHYVANSDAFTCWKCHNPHSYKINIRNTENLTQAIAYDNHICLNCHSNFDRFQLLTDRKEINIIQQHDWLPNQGLHFSQVRCIECHAQPNDSLLVAHQIMPKKFAVKRCVECHSQNSMLMASLYKFQAKENRSKIGFLNAIILNNAFVIGANRNVILNNVSVIIFLCGILLALGHLTLRMVYKKKE